MLNSEEPSSSGGTLKPLTRAETTVCSVSSDPGFQGPVAGGAAVIVRAADVERAWTLVVDTD